MCTVCVCARVHAPGSHKGQKRTPDPQKLEFQTVVSHHVVLGINPESLHEQPTLFTIELSPAH